MFDPGGPEYSIRYTLLAEDIYKGTSDYLRNLLGYYWKPGEAPDGSAWVQYSEYDFEEVTDLNLREVSRLETASFYIDSIEFNPDFAEVINPDSYLPNYKIPMRIYGSQENSRGDRFWNVLFNGGTFGEDVFPSIVDMPYVFYDEVLSFDVPYSKKWVNMDSDLDAAPPIEITCVYNSFSKDVEDYQVWTSQLESELLIPNINTIAAMTYHARASATEMSIPGHPTSYAIASQMGYDYLDYLLYPPLKLIYESFVIEEATGTPLDPDLVYPWARNLFIVAPGMTESSADDISELLYSTEMSPEEFQENKEFVLTAFMWWFADAFTSAYDDPHRYLLQSYMADQKDFIDMIPNTLKEKVKVNQQNMIFDASAFGSTVSADRDGVANSFPYYIKISFPMTAFDEDDTKVEPTPATVAQPKHMFSSETSYVFRNAIKNSNFDAKFLETLKDIHDGVFPEIEMSPKDYTFNSFWYDAESPSEYTSETKKVSLKTVDFVDLMVKAHNHYGGALNSNYQFVGTDAADYLSIQEDFGIYRYLDSQNILDCFNASSIQSHTYFEFMNFATAESDVCNQTLLDKVIQPQSYSKHVELLAYRIEKRGGHTTGDQTSSNVLQNFWIFNTADEPATNVTIYDSQIKYDTDYTYSVSAYALTLGYRYRYGDFRLTQQIGVIDDDPENLRYCLQFYDPSTDEYASQLFYRTAQDSDFGPLGEFGLVSTRADIIESGYESGVEAFYGETDTTTGELTDTESSYWTGMDALFDTLGATGILSDAEFSALSLRNQFATDQQGYSKFPQLADLNFYIEPCLKIIEVPIYSKTLRVLDNPANDISTAPFQFIDDSHRIGFQNRYQPYREDVFPEPISASDINIKSHYLHAHDITESTEIELRSQAPPRFLEIYRSETKPTSMRDFENKLIKTIDLKIPESDNNYSDAIISERIKTNTKYYYVLRFLNENRMPGHLSQIVCAELIDDGGYVYSSFHVLSEEDYEKDIYSKPSINFKKLFQIQPNISQLELNTSEANFALAATHQKDNVTVGTSGDPIWGETFKIRLTSKKTGKKIDLNVLFKLKTEDRFSEGG